MDLTVLIVGLLIGVGIPLRNKAVREYRKKGGEKDNRSVSIISETLLRNLWIYTDLAGLTES